MQCPVCNNVQLVMSERQGIEIDYCPNCRGVWLDRGELDKIIERSVGTVEPNRAEHKKADRRDSEYKDSYDKDDRYRQHGYGEHGHYKKKKRGGFLEDLFDFD